MRWALVVSAVVLSGCENFKGGAADVLLDVGEWQLVSVKGIPLPLDTTKVGEFPLRERIRFERHPASATIIHESLSRDIQNRRRVRVDTMTGSVLAFSGCGGYVFANSKDEQEARESMQQMLSEYGVGAAGFTGQSRTLRNAPLYLRFSGDQLAAYSDDQCFDLERVYRRVRP